MLDKQILDACIESRGAWETVRRHLNSKELTPTVAFWWGHVNSYYNRDPHATRIDRAVLAQLGEAAIANPKHRESILAAVADAGNAASAPNVISAVLSLKRYNAVAEFAAAAMGKDEDKARTLLSAVNELWARESLGSDDGWQEAPSAADCLKTLTPEARIPILPDALKTRVGGGVRPGDHILVFGRTEVGKSLFAINMAVGFMRQARKKVLYISNEDTAEVIKARIICRAIKQSPDEVNANPSKAASRFAELGCESLLVVGHVDEHADVAAIYEKVDKYKPDVIVLDQIINLDGDADGLTHNIQRNAATFRSGLSRHNVVGVSIAQAGDKSERHGQESPIWLSPSDVYSSRVGLPATADLMLGVGADSTMLARGQRAISICKNKLYSGDKAREGFIVNVDTQRGIVS